MKNLLKITLLIIVFVTPSIAFAQDSLKEVALTFDDGPSASGTLLITKILTENKIPATFFQMGENVKKMPEITKEVFDNNFTIGNHSYTHSKKMKAMTRLELDTELSKTQKIIFKTIGKTPNWFRSPYGLTSPKIKKALNKNNLKQVLWNIDSEDWVKNTSTTTVLSNIVDRLNKNGKIILMHDGEAGNANYHQMTVDALPYVLKYLEDNNYKVVPLEKIILSKPYTK